MTKFAVTFLFFFLPVVLGAYYLVPRPGRNAVLVLASLALILFGVFLLIASLLHVAADLGDAGAREVHVHNPARKILERPFTENVRISLDQLQADFISHLVPRT